jgi:hypothetical protein
MAALPLFKLGVMALKIVTKPVANQVKIGTQHTHAPRAVAAELAMHSFRTSRFNAPTLLTLTTLTLSTLSTRMQIKNYAVGHPTFKSGCVTFGHFVNRSTTRMNLWSMSNARVKEVKSTLSESEAVKVGGDMMGELVVFTVFGSIVVVHGIHESREKAVKKIVKEAEEAAALRRIEAIEAALESVRCELELQRTDREAQQRRRDRDSSWWWERLLDRR